MATDPQIRSERPLEFRSTSEEVAVGSLTGGVVGSIGSLFLGAFVGAIGAAIGNMIGQPTLVAGTLIWLALCVVPLAWLKATRPVWLYTVMIAAGAAYLTLLQWQIHHRDIGIFYPWALSALPFGIVFGTVFETIHLARGGSTEEYVARGTRNRKLLAIGFVIGFLADLLSLGRQRAGATIAGLLGGGLSALGASSLLAWRGDESVAELFFGSVWNIAWASAAIGAAAGAASGFWAALTREKQEQSHRKLLGNQKMHRQAVDQKP